MISINVIFLEMLIFRLYAHITIFKSDFPEIFIFTNLWTKRVLGIYDIYRDTFQNYAQTHAFPRIVNIYGDIDRHVFFKMISKNLEMLILHIGHNGKKRFF